MTCDMSYVFTYVSNCSLGEYRRRLFPAHVYVHTRATECLHAHQVDESHRVVVKVVVVVVAAAAAASFSFL